VAAPGEDVAVQRTPPGTDHQSHAIPSPGAATCATVHPENGRGSAAANTRTPSWPQDRRYSQTTFEHHPGLQKRGRAGSAKELPPEARLAAAPTTIFPRRL